LSFATLVDWVEGRLPPDEAAIVAEQVEQADAATRADVAWLRSFAQISSQFVMADPPPEVRQRLVRRFEATMQGRQQPAPLRRLVAALRFDTSSQPAPVGIRAAGTPLAERQLIYSTDLIDIALNIHPRLRDRRLDINGQIFAEGQPLPDRLGIQLLIGTTEQGITYADDLGEFVFEAVPPGSYDLAVVSDRFEVVIPQLELKA
jgi:hypothetical protein